jgi:glycosyltransferase involved in cell wall biosynthesis/SAM-dependent methyltransferase
VSEIEVTVVMPCLNEADTVATCVEKALRGLAQAQASGEVVVADNGSTDGSQEKAEKAGARVVAVEEKGYGAALIGGIAAARGPLVIMGDADDSYDFLEIPRFVEKLREGFDLVQGCRLPSGGGRVMPGAMPFLHRWLGNPFFSLLARVWFKARVRDVYCGLRGFRRDFQAGLDQRCTGMEFATEMVLKSSLVGGRIAELPITLHPDGRQARAPHLQTFRDGWRTLRLLLLYNPGWVFLIPGLVLVALGLLGYALALPAVRIGGVTFDAHTLLFASLALIVGSQALVSFLIAKAFAVSEGLLPPDPRLRRFLDLAQLEKGLIVALVACLTGSVLLLAAVNQWRLAGFGALDYARTMRWVIPGATLFMLGVQAALSSFTVSLLAMQRRDVADLEDIGRQFDRFHTDYDEALSRGLSVTGLDKLFFARARIAFLADRLRELGRSPLSVLDFGCGNGTAIPLFRELLQAETIVGVDASELSLAAARDLHGSSSVTFRSAREYTPEGAFSLAFCNGVFHHVPPEERPGVARLIRDSLEPGGLFALWDNNPWNPAARYVMWRIPFDRDAVMLSARAARRLLEEQGFEVLRVDHLFIFPRVLQALRPLEKPLAALPLGAQFQVLARRPAAQQ